MSADAELTGRTALVTGAGSGIGREVSAVLTARGATVAVNDLDPDAAAAVAAEGPPDRAHPLVFDVGDPAAVDAAVDAWAARHGHLDILVNCAGTGPGAPPGEGPYVLSIGDREWAAMWRTHVTGAFHCSRAAVRHMAPRRGGSIVNVSSTAGLYGGIALHYGTAKAAMVGFTKTLSHDLGPSGIRVNAVAPGFVDTPMISGSRAAAERLVAARTDIGRLVTPREVAEVIAFLAGDGAAACTGEIVEVSGGLRWLP